MADSNSTMLDNSELHALANRLIEHADSITNVAARQMEKDLRLAAKVILTHVSPTVTHALLHALHIQIEQVAYSTTDDATRRMLRELIGAA